MKGHRTDLHVVLYGDVEPDLVDGATVWLQSTATALTGLGLDRLEVVLKSPPLRDVVVGPLRTLDGCDVIEPDQRLTSAGGAEAVAAREPDIVVVRGRRAALAMAQAPELDGRLWTYLTDIAQHPLLMTPERRAELAEVVSASEVVLCQTDDLRGHIETQVPEACGRTALLPPILPQQEMPHRGPREVGTPIRLAYSGKFAPQWLTLEMVGLPAQLAEEGVEAHLLVIGDKFHPGDEGEEWRTAMRAALEGGARVEWLGAMDRMAALDKLAEADVGLAWRDPALDVSLELSTKLLEYGAIGLPALVNRTDAHVALLGEDYPLFVADEQEVVAAVRRCRADHRVHQLAADRLAAAAASHTLASATERLARLFARRRPQPSTVVGPKPRHVLVAGHDFGFWRELGTYLSTLPTVELHYDRWTGLHDHDRFASLAALADAETVFIEWAGPAAVWYARHVRPDQRLVVRLHRMELYRGWPRALPVEKVDALVCVNEHHRRLVVDQLGWAADRVVVIPNHVDHLDLGRPKTADALHRLGMIGVTSMRKRLDLGLEVLARLRRRDPRFSLVIKSKLPDEQPWFFDQPAERRYVRDVQTRLATEPLLRGAVHVDRYGPDVAQWLRRVGWVLSTSEDESFHLAPAEGMASGAVPVLRDWPGVEGIYNDRWIHESVDGMVAAIETAVADGTWADLAAAATHEAGTWSVVTVARQFEELLLQ